MKGSDLKLANSLWLLGMFGFTHGAHEWLVLGPLIEGEHLTFPQIFAAIALAAAVVLLSFVFLHTLSSLASPIRRNILKLLFARDHMRLMEITRELGIEDHTKVVFHLKILKESGIIEQDIEKYYSLTREGMKTIDCLKTLENFLAK